MDEGRRRDRKERSEVAEVEKRWVDKRMCCNVSIRDPCDSIFISKQGRPLN